MPKTLPRPHVLSPWVAVALLASAHVPACGQTPTFLLKGEPSEVPVVAAGAAVTPTISPSGWKGRVVQRGSGSVSFVPAAVGAGLSFGPGGHQNSHALFFTFEGSRVETLFGAPTGEVRFTWISRWSFAERLAFGRQAHRTAFDVYDEEDRRFSMQASTDSGRLFFTYMTGGSSSHHYVVPAGQENALFGRDARLAVRLVWDASGSRLYLNGTLVDTNAERRAEAEWDDEASFTIGARDPHHHSGGWDASDDVIDEFTVLGPGSGGGTTTGPPPSGTDSTRPTVAITAPSGGATVAGTVTLTAQISDNVGVAGMRWSVDGVAVGAEKAAAPWAQAWNTASVPNGPHTVTATARDAAGNTTTRSVAVTVANVVADVQPPSMPTGFAISAVTSGSVTLSWTASTDNVGVTGYRIYRNGALYTGIARTNLIDNGLSPATTYTYQISAVDAAGNESPRSAQATTTTAAAGATVRRVGPGKAYARPCAAIAVAQPGDVIEIEAGGDYDGDVCRVHPRNITLRGVNGRPHIRADGRSYGGKAIWVITGADVTVENIEFSGARVPDRNGTPIRMEGNNLTVRDSYFHDNQNGLTSSSIATGDLLIENCEFARNGIGNGLTHNVYVSSGQLRLTFRYNYSHHGKSGHLLKTRARENHILYNRLTDETGYASYELDIPNAGRAYVIGNIFQQSNATQNRSFINYGREGLRHPNNELYVVNNTFVNNNADLGATIIAMHADITTPPLLQNNIIMEAGPTTIVNVPRFQPVTNCTVANPLFVNPGAYDYRLQANSPCLDAGTLPGFAAGVDLTPTLEYTHKAKSRERGVRGRIDAGALERLD